LQRHINVFINLKIEKTNFNKRINALIKRANGLNLNEVGEK